MRSLTQLFGAILLLGFIFGCSSDDSSDDVSLDEQLMVEAYIYANEHVNHVKIARVNNNGEADLIPVNDASVKISQGEVSANLVLKAEAEGIYEINDPEFFFSGEEPLMLEVVYDGKTYKSSTHFPPALENINITNDHVNITEAVNDQLPLTNLSWSGSADHQTYCIFARGVESDTTSTYPVNPSHDSPLFSLHNGKSIDLFSDHFTFIGSYQLYVSAVNDEFMEMYSDGSDPELRGAPSNIEGAWGVFTAFNGLSVDVTVE